MHEDRKEIEDEEWILWNGSIGIRDFVTIGRIDADERIAWLEAPYDRVGPFSLDELTVNGLIRFAACVVMSRQRWQNDREELYRVSRMRRQEAQQTFLDELERHNRRKRNTMHCIEKEHRILLGLPEDGTLEISQIRSAYRRAAKKSHPDAGGSQELFIRVKEACDALLDLL